MNIVHVGFNHRYDDIRIFQKECSSLAGIEGYNVTYITSNKNTADAINVSRNGVQIITLPVIQAKREKRLVDYLKKVREKLEKIQPDIIHIHEFELLPLINYVRKNACVIYDAHEDIPRQMLGNKINTVRGRIVEKLIELYENHQIKKVDYVLTATPHIEERFRLLNKNVATIANYPILENFQEKAVEQEGNEKLAEDAGKNGRIVCYSGSISSTRGIEILVEAIQKVNATLSLAGRISEEYRAKIEKLDAKHRVTCRGFLDKEQIIQLYKDSTVGVCTLLYTPNHYWSLPIKMFEYMAAGLPIVCSDFPMWKDIVESSGAGICVKPDNPNEIAKAIEYLLENPEMAKKMGESGREKVMEKYNWYNEEKKLLEIYALFQTKC